MDEMMGCADRLAGWAASHEPISEALRIEVDRAAALLRRVSERERVMREALFEIRSVLDENMGDTDPIGMLPTDDVLRDEEPHFYCCIIASRALATLESDNG